MGNKRCDIHPALNEHSSYITGFKQACICIEAAGIQDSVLGAEKFGDFLFELFVYFLRTADEADRGETISPFCETILSGLDNVGMVGKTQIVIGT